MHYKAYGLTVPCEVPPRIRPHVDLSHSQLYSLHSLHLRHTGPPLSSNSLQATALAFLSNYSAFPADVSMSTFFTFSGSLFDTQLLGKACSSYVV